VIDNPETTIDNGDDDPWDAHRDSMVAQARAAIDWLEVDWLVGEIIVHWPEGSPTDATYMDLVEDMRCAVRAWLNDK